VQTSNVTGSINGSSVSFTRKSGSGKENEWRASISKLAPSSDVISISCTLTGTNSKGQKISVPFNITYSGYSTLNGFIQNCPDKSGYDIDISAQNISESFTVDRTIEKEWDDNNNQDNKRPDSIQVQLKANGENYGDKITLNEENGWKVELTDLPKYSSGTNEIVYTVVEDSVDNYTPSYAYNGETITITNTITEIEKTSVTVNKVWKDNDDQDRIRPDRIKVYLMIGDKVVDSVHLSEANQWTYTFTNLDKYADGQEIVYTVREFISDDLELPYITEITGSMAEGYTITNTHIPATIEKITVSKTWEDLDDNDRIRPEDITVYLYGNDSLYDSIVLNEDNDWNSAFINVPKYDKGEEINYKIEEIDVEGYTSEIKGNITEGFEIVNYHEPEELDPITIQKVWVDEDDKDEIRPDSITVYLLANGDKECSLTLTKEENWQVTLEGLYKYRDGEEIEYTIVEEEVEGYTSNVDGFTITNTHEVKEEEKKEEPKKEDPKKNNTNTGVTSSLKTYISLFTISGLALILLSKKRK
ncbi:MAG: Cna B-type domain-containing protein, partial [Floccifex porci]|uniref:Cna B-type domain-containing protein n=1 Tax=Floccifex porci TaxID=2606629 RepID=UPI0023EFB0EF